MARIETWFEQDLKKPVIVHKLDSVFSQDAKGNLIGVKVFSDGVAVALTDSITGYCVLADGSTVPVSGSRSGNQASIVLPASAYNVLGPIMITVKNTGSDYATTLCAVAGLVVRSRTGSQVDPGSVVTDWTNQISAQLQAVQTAADNLGSVLAVPFSNLTAYSAGNYVMKDGNLYCFTTDHAAGDWNSSQVRNVKLANEVADLKSAFNNITSVFYSGNPAKNDVIFTSDDVSDGETVYYELVVNDSTKAAFIQLFDSSNNVLALWGKGSAAYGDTYYCEEYVIPSGFSYAKYGSSSSAANVMTVRYVSKQPQVNILNNNIKETTQKTTVICKEQTIPGGRTYTRIFDTWDIQAGEKIKYSMHVDASNDMAFYIEFYNASGTSLGAIGKTSSGGSTRKVEDIATVPSGFSYAMLGRSGSSSPVYIDFIERYSPVIKQIDSIVPIVDLGLSFIQGTFTSQGTIKANAYNIASGPTSLPIGTEINIVIASGYKLTIAEWNEIPGNYTYLKNNIVGEYTYVVKDNFQMFDMFVDETTEIVPSEASNAQLTSHSFKYVVQKLNPVPPISPSDTLESTGDTTDRSADILAALQTNKIVNLGKGNFHIASSITVPEGTTIRGQGDNTVLIAGDSSLTEILNLTTETTVRDLKMKGTISSNPGSFGSMHGIKIVQQNSNNRVENVSFEGFTGACIYSYNTYNQSHNSNIIDNCRCNTSGCGIYVGMRSEAFAVSNCVILHCFIGIHCIGGNNRITACLMRSCTYGLDMTSSSSSDNDGHSVFTALVIIHNTHAIKISTIEFGSILNACSIFYGDISVENSHGILFIGNNIGSVTGIASIDSDGIRISNSVFQSMEPSVVSGVSLNDCTKLDGTPFETT